MLDVVAQTSPCLTLNRGVVPAEMLAGDDDELNKTPFKRWDAP
jgi:hypothetical protein